MFVPYIFWEARMGATEVPGLCVQPLCAWGPLWYDPPVSSKTWLTGQFSNEMEIWLGKTHTHICIYIYMAFSIVMFDYPEGSSWFVDGGQRKTEKIRSSAFTNAFAAAQVKVSRRSVAQIFESHPSFKWIQMAQIQTKQEYSTDESSYSICFICI